MTTAGATRISFIWFLALYSVSYVALYWIAKEMTYLAAYPSNEVISQALLILDSHFAS
jgi:hypothetical protein